MRAELAQPGIGLRSVYLSQRDSVISGSALSRPLPPAGRHQRAGRPAAPENRAGHAADARLRIRFQPVDRLETDDQALEALVAEFTACREAWLTTASSPRWSSCWATRAPVSAHRTARRQRPPAHRPAAPGRPVAAAGPGLRCAGTADRLVCRQLDDDSALDEERKRIRLESDEDLVKLVTIHVAKGLEYPVVFLPFFFLPWRATLTSSCRCTARKATASTR